MIPASYPKNKNLVKKSKILFDFLTFYCIMGIESEKHTAKIKHGTIY